MVLLLVHMELQEVDLEEGEASTYHQAPMEVQFPAEEAVEAMVSLPVHMEHLLAHMEHLQVHTEHLQVHTELLLAHTELHLAHTEHLLAPTVPRPVLMVLQVEEEAAKAVAWT